MFEVDFSSIDISVKYLENMFPRCSKIREGFLNKSYKIFPENFFIWKILLGSIVGNVPLLEDYTH